VRRQASDEGTAMPLFIFGMVFLSCLAMVLIGSGQLLQAQRRVNGATDSIALDLVVRGLARGSGTDIGAMRTQVKADIADLYPTTELTLQQVVSPEAGEVELSLCMPVMTIAAAFGQQRVCATSRAGVR
jgi:Flp pilus assembly protein TadG